MYVLIDVPMRHVCLKLLDKEFLQPIPIVVKSVNVILLDSIEKRFCL